MRFDQFIQQWLEGQWGISVSRGLAGRLIAAGLFRINGEVVKKKSFQYDSAHHFFEWDQVSLVKAHAEYLGRQAENEIAEQWSESATPQQIQDPKVGQAPPISSDLIIDENDDYMVVYKPAGVYSHPGIGTDRQTLLDRVYSYLGNARTEYIPRGGLVHRLDRETQGLVLFAKNLATYNNFREQFESRAVVKLYYAVAFATPRITEQLFHTVPPERVAVESVLNPWNTLARADFREVEGFISRSRQNHQMMVFKEALEGSQSDAHTGRWAKSRVWPLSSQNGLVLLAVQIFTGRTHQIRAQLKSLGLPIVNDPLYGKPLEVGQGRVVGSTWSPLPKDMNLGAIGIQFSYQGGKKSYTAVDRFLPTHST